MFGQSFLVKHIIKELMVEFGANEKDANEVANVAKMLTTIFTFDYGTVVADILVEAGMEAFRDNNNTLQYTFHWPYVWVLHIDEPN